MAYPVGVEVISCRVFLALKSLLCAQAETSDRERSEEQAESKGGDPAGDDLGYQARVPASAGKLPSFLLPLSNACVCS